MAGPARPEYTVIDGVRGGLCPRCGRDTVRVQRQWHLGITVVHDFGVRCPACGWEVLPPERMT